MYKNNDIIYGDIMSEELIKLKCTMVTRVMVEWEKRDRIMFIHITPHHMYNILDMSSSQM